MPPTRIHLIRHGQGSKKEKILLLPSAQEATDLPSDTGSDRKVLESEFGSLVDCSLLIGEEDDDEGWRSNRGFYSPEHDALRARAKSLRAWLAGREEGEDGVVGHGQFWHWVTGEVDGEGRQTSEFLFSFSFLLNLLYFLCVSVWILLTKSFLPSAFLGEC
mgnify:CR=1 FL=1